jgi:hypothetical protein
VDNGEVIALDIPYGLYASQQTFYREAFIEGMAAALDGPTSLNVFVVRCCAFQLCMLTRLQTNFQQSSRGTTLVYFDTIISGSDYDVVAASAAVRALFDTSASICSSTTPVGCPAHLALLAAFSAAGLPALASYYSKSLWRRLVLSSHTRPLCRRSVCRIRLRGRHAADQFVNGGHVAV